ncbi:acyltransferase [Paramuribaculum intestinale]|uniref:acyltransferase n=1 Tax=Paramuribaculum intestinale TaxID=2094151 RepID=UPI0025AF4F49|nr:acyltransferase [Paramuribaculum intestinale]
MKQRDTSLDIIRLLACFMVVVMHSPLPSANANGQFLVALSYFTAPCIGLFFMVSGALLLPVKTDYFTFLRRRFGKVAVPTVVWSLIYIALQLYYSKSEINVLQAVASIPFSAQGEGVLWFMYTLCGLYLLAPILSGWLERATKREVEFVLLLWAVTLCYPLLRLWFSVNDSDTGPLYYFGGYAGYFLLGYYLRRYPGSISAWLSGGLALVGAILLCATKRYGIELDFYSVFWYLSIFVAALCVALWIVVSKIAHRFTMKDALAWWLSLLANLSFGVYLIHILVMRYWLWQQGWILSITNYVVQCLVIATITIILSIVVCLLISLMPKSDWIIGFHNKKAN